MKNYITGGIIVLLLAGFFWLGFKAHERFRPCPVVKSDTVKIYDTMPHQMPTIPPGYIIKHDSIKFRDQKWMDSVLLASKIDTAAILANYFMLNYYTREWEDSLLYAKSEDVITENKFIDNIFIYRIKRPQTVINNSVTDINYSSYLYFGGSVPMNDIKMANLGLYFANKRLLFGVGYIPDSKGVNVTGAIKFAKFKGK